jgi:hypothetical protein
MHVRNTVQAIPLSTVAASTLDGTYTSLNTGLPFACFYIRILNDSTVPITVSYDGGETDHDFIAPAGTITVNAQTNSQPNGNIALFAKGQSIWINGTVGTGAIYLSGYYQPAGI